MRLNYYEQELGARGPQSVNIPVVVGLQSNLTVFWVALCGKISYFGGLKNGSKRVKKEKKLLSSAKGRGR